MNKRDDILGKIKSISWSKRENFLQKNPGKKFLSTYAINDLLSKPTDFEQIAINCSQNPNHEHFGKDPKEISKIWKEKKDKGSERGINLEDYIKFSLDNNLEKTSKFSLSEDQSLLQKISQYDIFEKDYLIKNNTDYVGSEIWLTDDKYGINVRLDSLFYLENYLLSIDWKSNANISFENRFENMLGPLSHIEKTDCAKMMIQAFIYRYILESYNIDGFKIFSRVLNILEGHFAFLKFPLKYSKELMESIFEFAIEEKVRREKNKIVFIINGKPISGKDTFCELFNKNTNENSIVHNISTVDHVKKALGILGWNGEKTPEDRDALSDLKDLSTRLYDGPFKIAKNHVEKESFNYLFIHCREWPEICRMKEEFNKLDKVTCKTLFINRNVEVTSSNHADNKIDENKSEYDIIIENLSTLENFELEIKKFIKNENY